MKADIDQLVAHAYKTGSKIARIAVVSPVRPSTSAIAEYTETLLPPLRDLFAVDLYTPDSPLGPAPIDIAGSRVHGARQLGQALHLHQYDEVVFQLGNSAEHVEAYDILLRYGGVAVLHDLNLSGIVGAKTLGQNRVFSYFKELANTEGPLTASKALAGFALTRRLPDRHAWWMNRSAIRASRSIVVHNEFAASRVRSVVQAIRHKATVHVVPLPMPQVTGDRKGVTRLELGLDEHDFVVGSFGVLDESKRIAVALRAFARVIREVPNARYVLIGNDVYGYGKVVRSLNLERHVIMTGRVSSDRFDDYIRTCNFCVNLRYPSHGEASAAMIRVMSLGKTVAVTNDAQFRDFPDDACIKIDLGPSEEMQLAAEMLQMARHPERLATVGARARAYVNEHHSLRATINGYVDAIVSACSSPWDGGSSCYD